MYEKIFSQVGLSEQEAVIYEVMLELGEARAKEIYQKSPFKRGLVYKILDNLIEKHLLVRIDRPGAVSVFRIEHPDKINDLMEAQERKIRHYKKSIQSLMPELISSYNLAFNKPGIKFYEGREGLTKVLNDSLKSKTEILTYADIFGMEKYLGSDNATYVKKRQKLNIQKRGIVTDTPYARDFLKDYDSSVTDIRFIDHKKFPLSLEMEIYDNKISFLTFSEKHLMGVIIENKEIYETQKSIFEMIWANATPIKKSAPSAE